MRLRRPCPHDRYDKHRYREVGDDGERQYSNDCPGGEFLPEDALVIKLCEHGLFDRHSLDLETLDYEEIFCPGGEMA